MDAVGPDPRCVQPQVPSAGLVSQSVIATAGKSSSRVYKQNSQSDVSQSQGLQQSPTPSGSASDPDYSAEQLSRKQSHSSRGLPSNSDPSKKRRHSIEHAQDLSRHLPDGKAQPHGAPESNKPVSMQANSAVEVPKYPHSYRQQLQQDKQAGWLLYTFIVSLAWLFPPSLTSSALQLHIMLTHASIPLVQSILRTHYCYCNGLPVCMVFLRC